MDILFYISTFLIIVIAIGLFCKLTNSVCQSEKRLDGKTCLVTGGTGDIGTQITLDLAKRGARVIIATPFPEEGEVTKQRVIKESKNDNIEFMFIDLSSFDSVRKFTSDFLRTEKRLDILMNNAAVSVPIGKTKDGMNVITQVNFLGPYLLTLLLLPLLKKSGTASEPSRIVNTNSVSHTTAVLNLQNLNKIERNLIKRIIVYSNSKLCLLLFSRELSKRIAGSPVVINDADPGVVGTRIYFSGNNAFIGYTLMTLFYIFSKSPWSGAQTPLHAALDYEAGQYSGKFYKECAMRTPTKAARDDETAAKLWKMAQNLVQLSDEEMQKCLK